MSLAIIRAGNGRRHEVGFGDDPARLDVSIGEATVRIIVEVTADPGPPNGRRSATLAVPREELIAALGAAFGRAVRPVRLGRNRAWCAPSRTTTGEPRPERPVPGRTGSPGKGGGARKS